MMPERNAFCSRRTQCVLMREPLQRLPNQWLRNATDNAKLATQSIQHTAQTEGEHKWTSMTL